ncbi:MAG TPA: hypothetical protein VFE78_39380, partial [Gemmataceae bacterium]|nr:hypothetical protein [Gemmataceae bacterium]
AGRGRESRDGGACRVVDVGPRPDAFASPYNRDLPVAGGEVLVTNDAHLLALAGHVGLEVVRPADVWAY